MFPSSTRRNNILLQNSSPYSLQSNRLQTHQSTHLPYFKKLTNNKLDNSPNQKTRILKNTELHNSQHQSNKQYRRKIRFLTQERQRELEDVTESLKKPHVFCSSKDTKPSKHGKKLFKQIYERANTKKRHRSEQYPQLTTKKPTLMQQLPNGKQILRVRNNLTSYEKQQIINYEHIYYYGQNCAYKKLNNENKETYNWSVGDHVQYRYEFLELLGQGSFGQVFKCLDHKYDMLVALKIVKNNKKYTKQAKIQVQILNFLKCKDPIAINNCIQIKDFFLWRKQVCMVFPLISINLYQLLKKNSYYGLPLDLIRRLALQILNAVHFLHKNHIIHADLKPQNILLKQQNKSGIKVIDFGSSCFENQILYTYIQSRYYRAPEIILGIPYNRKIDIWSFGCIIAELHLGFPLFAGDDQHQQMALLIEVLGYPPKRLMRNAKRWHLFFKNDYQLISKPKQFEACSRSLYNALENPQNLHFVQFIRLCLQWDPDVRFQALQCLKDQWVLDGLPADFKNKHLEFIRQEEDKKYTNKSTKTTFTLHHKNRLM